MSEVHTMRDRIMDISITLIAERGYENVSMREIAKDVGIKVSSIYNHYESKDALLDNIYDFYAKHRPTPRDEGKAKEVIETGSNEEIIRELNRHFLFNQDENYSRMVLTTKIIAMRCYTDERANDLFFNTILGPGEGFLHRMLQYGVDIGRFHPFDTYTYAKMMVGQYYFMGIKNFCRKDYTAENLDEEKDLESLFIYMLPMKERVLHGDDGS